MCVYCYGRRAKNTYEIAAFLMQADLGDSRIYKIYNYKATYHKCSANRDFTA